MAKTFELIGEHWLAPKRKAPWFLDIESAYRPEAQVQFIIEVPNPAREFSTRDWLDEKIRHAVSQLREVISVNPTVRGGTPVLKGTRMPLSRILAELADDASLSEIATQFALDKDVIEKLLEGLSLYLDQPFSHDRLPAR